MNPRQGFIVLLVLTLLLSSCKKASQTANEMADQVAYQPIEYVNAKTAGPAVVILPGSVKSGHILYRQKIGDGNIADFGEMEMEKAGFPILDRANLDAIVEEISLAAQMADPQALKLFRKGKFANARFLVRFDVIKAERLSQSRKSFDGALAGALVGGILAGVTDSAEIGTATGTAIASIKSDEETSVWGMGMRYTVIDAVTGVAVFTGEVDETVDVRRTLKGFLGSTEQKSNLLPLDAVTLRMVQQCVARIDSVDKAAMNAAPSVPAGAPKAQADRKEKDILAQYEQLKRKKEEERQAAVHAARFEGIYSGKFAGGTKGDISLIVSGDRVEGRVTNADGLQGVFTGSFNCETGAMNCELAGNISIVKFTGAVTGAVRPGQASGEWVANGWGTEKGTWSAAQVK